MELSLLCDQVCFLYILDKNQGRVIHFASHPEENFIDMFNKGFTREFYTNDDVSYMPYRPPPILLSESLTYQPLQDKFTFLMFHFGIDFYLSEKVDMFLF
jgi:hypothetical protein